MERDLMSGQHKELAFEWNLLPLNWSQVGGT
jgi:hypothetical protein